MADTLYHYCSLETFLKILSNKTLRASDCSKTNDTEEIRWISRAFSDVMISDVLEHQPIIDKYGLSGDNIKSILELLPRLVESMFEDEFEITRTYTMCFSESSDSLSQWRGYADDSKGIAIGFDKKILSSFNEVIFHNFGKVIYNPDVQRNYIRRNMVSLFLNSDDPVSDFDTFSKNLALATYGMRQLSAKFKNPAFSEEKEWRLFVNIHPNTPSNVLKGRSDLFMQNCDLSNGFIRNRLSFTQTNSRLVSYIDFNFEKIKDAVIKKVILGPKCDASASDIELFLFSQSYNPVITERSKATYR